MDIWCKANRGNIEPKKQGQLSGYCGACGMMKMKGEINCPREECNCKETVKEAPEARDFQHSIKYYR